MSDEAAASQREPPQDPLEGPVADPSWRLEDAGYDPSRELKIESRFTVSNGFLGVRASLEDPTRTSRPRTFVAGLFDLSPTEPRVPALISAPDWLRLGISLEDDPFRPGLGSGPGSRRVLDLRHGALWGEWNWTDREGRVLRLRTLRFVSLANPAVAVQAAWIEIEGATVAAPARLTIDAWIERPLVGLELEESRDRLTMWRTSHTRRRLAMATAARLELPEDSAQSERLDRGAGGERWSWTPVTGDTAQFVRLAAVQRGAADSSPSQRALEQLGRAEQLGVRELFEAHVDAWAQRWECSDVQVEGDEVAQRALRFAVYHLIGAPNPEDDRVSIGARALTGDAYMGHVFWDTDIFLLPFYVFTWPAAARALVMYRFHTLPAARAKAAELGYVGALYAWESADDGEEATPPYITGPNDQVIIVRTGTLQQHISADVAYAVWNYWRATGDDDFLLQAGAEMLLETARFWASRVQIEADGCYHIRGVIGPDEYHEEVDDNGFTNIMAQWNLERALDLVDLLRGRWPRRWQELRGTLAITDEELGRWRDVADRMATGMEPLSRLIEQFSGFFDLEPVYVTGGGPSTPLDLVQGRERTQRWQIVKQPDVVLLLALLEDSFPQRVRETNFRFYEARCGHGSSLSPAVHALVAARLGDVRLAERYLHQAAAIDLDDTMGNVGLGVHIGALGGLWQAVVLGFAGMRLRDDGLAFAPFLAVGWSSLQFRAHWHGRRVRIRVESEPRSFTATLELGDPMMVYLDDLVHQLTTAEPWTCRWDPAELAWRETV